MGVTLGVRRAGVLSLLVLALLVPARAGAATVDAGGLRAQLGLNPWHLTFEDRRGREVLRELTGGSGPSGALGFHSPLGWAHATKATVVSTGRRRATLRVATSDPAGRFFNVRVSGRPIGGVIDVDAEVAGPGAGLVDMVGVGFRARAGERYIGFGERSNGVNQRGGVVRNYVSEGPYQQAEYPFLTAFIPPPGYNTRRDATYYPVPWLLSTNGYGVLVRNHEESRFRLGSEQGDEWSVEVDAQKLRYQVFAGPRPRDALRRMTALTGRQPPAEAPFFFGPWFQEDTGDQESIEILRAADAPASVGQTYTHYLPCGDHQGNEDGQRERTALYHRNGLAVTTYFNPMICTDYDPVYQQAVDAGVLHRDITGQPYVYKYTGSTIFFVSQFDFSNPATTSFYGNLLAEAVGHGYDGWMEDFGEYTPPDVVSHDGTPGPAMHNRYVTLYHRAARTYASATDKPLARFNRSGWTGAAAESQIVWGGDPTTSFDFDGLESAVYNGLSMGASGVSLWGSDIGGFFALSVPQTTPELLARWLEFGFASGVMRTQANGFDLVPSERAQIFDGGILPVWRRYAKLRTQLYPYLAAAQRVYDRTGLPMMRSLALMYPGDRRGAALEDEYLFGPDLLVAPVVTEGARHRSVYLPKGRWVNFWKAVRYLKQRGGGFALRRAKAVPGRRSLRVRAPLAELPMFVRAGAVLPMLPSDVDTLAGYGREEGLVHLRDRRGQMTLLTFPRGKSARPIGDGENVISREGRFGWALAVRGKVRRRYSLQASMATLRRPFAPCAMSVDGRRLPGSAWSWSRRAKVLRVSFRARRGLLVAHRCRSVALPGR